MNALHVESHHLESGVFFTNSKNPVPEYQGTLMVPMGQYFLDIYLVQQQEEKENN